MTKRLLPKLSMATLLVVGPAVSVSAGAADAVPAPIHTTDWVNVRPGPSIGSGSPLAVLPPGASPDFVCWTHGQDINGVDVWFQVHFNGVTGYYASYYDDSRYATDGAITGKYGIPECGASAPAPAPVSAPPAELASALTNVGGVELGPIGTGWHNWGPTCVERDYYHSSAGWVIVAPSGLNSYVDVRNGMLFGWFDQGGGPGWLGCPVTDEFPISTADHVASVVQQFQHGWLYWTSGMDHATPISSTAVQEIAWADRYLDSGAYAEQCLRFVALALQAGGVSIWNSVNVPIGNDTYPVDVWGHFTRGTTGTGTNPPVGALLFYAAKNGDRTLSHVTISAGEGRQISTADAIASSVHYETIAQHSYANYLGWWMP